MQQGNHRDLIVWQKAMIVVMNVYRLTQKFPKEEMYGLSSQMRRAAVSIPSNIAEGRRRGSENEYRQFLNIAFGSGAELETQLEIAEQLGYGDGQLLKVTLETLAEVMRMLNKMTTR